MTVWQRRRSLEEPSRARLAPGPRPRPAPQALAALALGTLEEELALLRTAGILDEHGELAKTYMSWGRKPSRTPEVDDEE
jgi:hypothetical protein